MILGLILGFCIFALTLISFSFGLYLGNKYPIKKQIYQDDLSLRYEEVDKNGKIL